MSVWERIESVGVFEWEIQQRFKFNTVFGGRILPQ